jgi:hypothetical protein
MKIKIFLKPVSAISTATINEMWKLYDRYYEYDEAYFRERIHSRNTHFAFFYKGKQLVGFTGLRINRLRLEGRKVLLMYFGQAVMEKAHRGKNLLRRMSIKIGFKYLWDLIFSEGYCWCDAVSFKSYMFFAKGFTEMYPNYKVNTPAKEQEIIRQIGTIYYPDQFCPETGTVRKEQNFVIDPSAQISTEDLKVPHIKFYAEANPGHERGDGLITITSMSFKNLFYLISHMLKRIKLFRSGLFHLPIRQRPQVPIR